MGTYSGQQNELQSTQNQILEKQSTISLVLADIAASHRRLELSVDDGPMQLKNDIRFLVHLFLADKSTKNRADELESNAGSSRSYQLPLKLLDFTQLTISYARELKIVESLRYAEITEREERIIKAHPTTFDWLFQETRVNPQGRPHPSLLSWLRTSSGSYWISGKAGSGKSTFMKYLCQNDETIKALQVWAGEHQLVTASFYFWHAGTLMQKSQQGLLQTLLFHILRKCPQLVSSVCQLRWQQNFQLIDTWTYEELYKAFQVLNKSDVGSKRFCFFIDGLDEYSGEHSDLIHTINNLVSGSKIKVLFSSRPWIVFEHAYGGDPAKKLQLHEFTEGDIRCFVVEKFAEDRRFQELKGTDRRYQGLIETIVKKAHGVFLWVFLVTRSLRRGLVNCDTLKELNDRLESLPTDLEDYFQHMLDSTEKTYQKQAARIYQMCLSALGSISLTTLSFFDRTELQFCLNEEMLVWTTDDIQQIRKNTKTRVMARCTDLLEVSQDRTDMDFLHRTVHDFLITRQVRELLEDRAGADFDADLHLGNAIICEMKHLSPVQLRTPFDQYEHCTSILRSFMYNIHRVELRDNHDYLPLVDEVDMVIDSLRGDTVPTYTSSVPTNLAAQYPKGWVDKMAVKERLLLYLFREKQLGRLNKNTRYAGRPPLDIVLRPHRDAFFCSSAPSLNIQLVRFFLETGMDPNAHYENSTVWALFLQDLKQNPYAEEGGISSRELSEVLECLLLAGANPDRASKEGEFSDIISIHCKVDDAKHVEDLRLRMQNQRSSKSSDNDASPDLVKTPDLARNPQKNGFRRVSKWLSKR